MNVQRQAHDRDLEVHIHFAVQSFILETPIKSVEIVDFRVPFYAHRHLMAGRTHIGADRSMESRSIINPGTGVHYVSRWKARTSTTPH